MKTTIIGGGFGLYGYLPALISCKLPVVLPFRYQQSLLERPDLAIYYSLIEWVSDDTILNHCEAVIMALPPNQQTEMLKKCLCYPNINYYLLEKPLAMSPSEANDLLNLMIYSKKKFRVGYNFRFTSWGKALLQQKKGAEEIVWEFRAHHYAHNIQTWKRYHETGGGALRFYGIHLVALLAELGYTQVLFSHMDQTDREVKSWQAMLGGSHVPNCRILVHTQSENTSFQVNYHGKKHYFTDPFQSSHMNDTDTAVDQRVPYLICNIQELFHDDRPFYDWYKHTNQLWQSIEAAK